MTHIASFSSVIKTVRDSRHNSLVQWTFFELNIDLFIPVTLYICYILYYYVYSDRYQEII